MGSRFGDLTRGSWLGRMMAALAFGVALFIPGAAAAQLPQIPPPAPYSPTDGNGINLFSGSYTYTTSTISVGPAGGGLSYSASFDTGANEWRHSVWGGVSREPYLPPSSITPAFTVTVMGQTAVFGHDGFGGYMAIEGNGTLTRENGVFTYIALDGAVAVFSGGATYNPYIANEGLISTLTRPNGEQLVFTYANAGTSGRVLRSVTSNRGYQLHFQYASDTSYQLVKVTALNNAIDACAPAANVCTFSRTWPSLTFGETRNGSVVVERTVKDANDHTTTLLSPVGRLTGIRLPTSASGQDITLTRDQQQPQKYATFSNGGTWNYTYVVPLPNPNPPVEEFYITTVRDPLGKDTVVEMSAVRSLDLPDYPDYRTTRVTSVTNPAGQKTEYAYTTNWNLGRVTHPEGNWETYSYNGRGDLVRVTRNPIPDSELAPTTVSASFTPGCPANPKLCGRPETITDARGNVSTYTYDETHGGLLTETGPAPTPGAVQPQTRYAYAEQHAWYKQNGSGSITQAGPIWVLTGTAACTTSVSCDGQAQEVQTSIAYQTGGAGAASNILPVSTTTGSGDGLLAATTTTVWDANGDPLTVNGPLPGTADTTRYIHDAMREQVGLIGPDPDGAGSRLFPATRTTYDGNGRPTFVERGTTTGQTDLAWDAFSSLQGAQTYYDTRGLVTRQVAFAGTNAQTITDYSYDGAGRPLCTAVRMNPAETAPLNACVKTAEGDYGPDRITRNSYDDAGRRLTKVESAVETTLEQATRTQGWTANGQIDWVEDANGNRSDYTWDDLGRLARLNFPLPTTGAHAANPDDYEAYTYDAADNPLTKRTRSGAVFTTTFDALNRATLIDAPAGSDDVEFRYDLLGRRTSASHAVGAPLNCATATVCTAWDALGRQVSETGPLGTLAWQYDLAGRRTRMTWPDAFYVTYDWDLDGSMTAIRQGAGATLITGYAWNDLGRRTGITRGNGVATTYSWDAGSRLASLSHDPAGTGQDLTLGYSWSPAGQVLWRTVSNPAYAFAPTAGTTAYASNGLNQSVAVGGATLTWSPQGNLTSDGTRSFTYDAANRLTGTTGSALTYDPLDRLYRATGTGSGYFLYDGSQLAGVYSIPGAGIAQRYVAGPSPDEWAVVYTGSGTAVANWYLQDPQQSVIALLTPNGGANWTLAYDAYGQPRAGNAGRMQYTGQMMLPAYGLQHYKARAYDAALGRFVQTDPVGYEQGLNLYAYVANDPVNATDPTGLLPYPGRPGSTGCVAGCDYSGRPSPPPLDPPTSSQDEERPPSPRGRYTLGQSPGLKSLGVLPKWWAGQKLWWHGISSIGLNEAQFGHIVERHGPGTDEGSGMFDPAYLSDSAVFFQSIVMPVLQSPDLTIVPNTNGRSGFLITGSVPMYGVGSTGTFGGLPSQSTSRVTIVAQRAGGGHWNIITAFPVR